MEEETKDQKIARLERELEKKDQELVEIKQQIATLNQGCEILAEYVDDMKKYNTFMIERYRISKIHRLQRCALTMLHFPL